MKRVIRLDSSRASLIPEGAGDESYSEELVEIFLSEFTRPGDLVLDPFAGFGTTLVVAERMGRRAIGIELLPERVEFARARLAEPGMMVEGDARRLREFGLPPTDFVMTSPPYMNKVDHPQNPLTGYRTLDGDYDAYVVEVGAIFRVIAEVLKPNGHVVINVANIRTGATVTPLARDVAQSLSSFLTLKRSVVVESADADPGIETDYCFVFGRL
jgi:DNA modification methylase